MNEAINLYTREIVKKWKRKTHEEIIMIQLMEKFHWSYEDYMNTPTYVIDLILAKQDIDYKFKEHTNGNQ